MKRRNFLKIFPAAGVTPFILNGFSLRPFANSRIARIMASCDGIQERALVLIQLKGGNDGLNVVIPIPQYDRYMQLRPNIGIKDTGTNGYIALDSTMPNADQVGLHPSMTGFKALYDRGWAALIQGAGYDSINQSHFKGTDIWLSGGDSSAEYGNLTTGWMGRALQAFYPDVLGFPTPDMPDPLGIQVGDPNISLGFHTETEHQNSINLSGQDPSGFFSLIQTIGGAPINPIPNTQQGQELDYIMGVEQSVNAYAQRITAVFNAGTNMGTYPTDSFSSQLKTVARMIRGGCKTKIYTCQLGGFDLHSAQVVQTDTGTGSHAKLLKTLSDGIKAFFDDLQLMGIADQVAACTFSEFGRCAKENGSVGTDHGTLAPMFVFGKNIRPKVHGTNVNLSDLTTDNQLKNKQFDYRQVFASLLQDWLGANPYVMQEALLDSYQKVFLVKKAATVSPGCYFGGSPIISDPHKAGKGPFSVSPNPASGHTAFSFESNSEFSARLSVHSAGGTLISISTEQVYVGSNIFHYDVLPLPAGNYFVRLENKNDGTATVIKMSVVR
jgi:uncharacterized protein (DUF1501 family)